MFAEDNQNEYKSDYEIKPDVSVTLTEAQEIERQKGELLEDLKKSKALKQVFQSSAIKASIYAFSRILLILGGEIGVYFSAMALLMSFANDNTEFFKKENIQYDGGLKIGAMEKLLKVGLSLTGSLFFFYSTIADWRYVVNLSNDAYHIIDEKIEKFNTPPKANNWMDDYGALVVMAVGFAGFAFVVKGDRK